MTTADRIAELADNNGSCFPDEFECALSREGFSDCVRGFYAYGDPVRHEFPDGSAIVVAGDAWDLGVHRDRADSARERYESSDGSPRDVRYAWVGAGYGLTAEDAFGTA